MDLSKLKDEFPETDIEWRVQRSGMKKDKPWAQILAYITNRAIMDRLDEVCAPENWKNEFVFAPDGGIMCAISIYVDNEWITKWDGAEKSEIEPFKGGLSNAMKRAAVQWGIGRYLYSWEAAWAEFREDGVYNAKIKDSSTGREEWHKWSPPARKNVLNPAPQKEKPVEDIHEVRVKEVDYWLLEMTGGVETEYKEMLKRVSTFTGNDGLEHFANSIYDIRKSKQWTNKTHHNTKELYEAWQNLQQNKKSNNKPEEYPGENELPF